MQKFHCKHTIINGASVILASFALIGVTSSCIKDSSEPLPSLKSEIFTSSRLALNYMGEEMPGKSIELIADPSRAGESQAELRMYSEFDLSQLSGMNLTGSIPSPGVLPGSAVVTLPVDLIPSDGCYIFSGAASSDFVDYSYSGKLEEDKLTLNLTDCKLKNSAFACSVFAPAPLKQEGLLEYSSLPFHLVWEIDPAGGIDIPLSVLLRGIMTARIIPVYNNTAYTSIAELFASSVKTIALNEDGNIPVMYISTIGGAARIATTCGNMFQYVVAGQGIKLYVNPLSALGAMLVTLSKPSDDAEFITKADSGTESSSGIMSELNPEVKKAFVDALLKAIAPSLSEGIDLSVQPTAKGADIFMDTDHSVIFLMTLFEDLLKEPEIKTALHQYLKDSGISDILPGILPEDADKLEESITTILENTTRLEIGLSLIKI